MRNAHALHVLCKVPFLGSKIRTKDPNAPKKSVPSPALCSGSLLGTRFRSNVSIINSIVCTRTLTRSMERTWKKLDQSGSAAYSASSCSLNAARAACRFSLKLGVTSPDATVHASGDR